MQIIGIETCQKKKKSKKKRNKHQKNRYKSVKKNNKSTEYQVVKY